MGGERQLSAERWAQIQTEVRNLRNHLAATELDHWRDSLRFLVDDIDGAVAKLPERPVRLAGHHAALAAWLERADVLTKDQAA